MHFLRQFRLIAALLAAFFVLSLTACGSGSNSFTWFVDSIPANLDPQVASSAADVIACENLYSGLVRRTPDGQLAPELCERWEVSADQRTYTFYLKDGLTYTAAKGSATDYAITAEDFVFAFQRIQQGSGSAAAREQFAAIAGMAAGERGSLGAAAPDDRTVIITLSRTDPLLPEKLAEPEAFPCREDFYTGTHARYGNTLENMIYNGPYTVKSWESDGLRLIPNSRYTGLTPTQNTGVIITLGRDNTMERFLEGLTDCCRVDSNTLGQLSGGKTSLLTFRNGTVSLLLNQASPQLAQEAMRQALCYSFPLAQYAQGGDLPDSYEYAGSIIPGAARLYDESYTDLTAKGFSLGSVTYPDGSSTSDFRRSDQLTITYNARAAAAALEQVKELPQGLTLLLPKGSALEGFCGWLQKQWLDHLGLVVNLAIVDADTYRSRLAKGDFTLALYSYTAGDELHTVFRHYGTGGGAPVQCADPHYGQLLDMASTSRNVNEAARLFANAEALLVDQFIVMPLFYTESYFAMAKGVSGIQSSADGTELFFATAKREG